MVFCTDLLDKAYNYIIQTNIHAASLQNGAIGINDPVTCVKVHALNERCSNSTVISLKRIKYAETHALFTFCQNNDLHDQNTKNLHHIDSGFKMAASLFVNKDGVTSHVFPRGDKPYPALSFLTDR